MKHHLPLVVLFALIGSSIFSCLSNYWAREACIRDDVQNALAMTMKERECGIVDADTIRTYRSHITIEEVRDTACITVKAVNNGGVESTVLEASAGCSFMTILASSNQRTSGTLAVMALLWAVGSLYYTRKVGSQLVPAVAPVGVVPTVVEADDASDYYGGIRYAEEQSRFVTRDGKVMRFTPMQQQLMEMFFASPSHSLTKQEICDALWPKKPDASDTLYTLIRRIKPVVEEYSDLRIETERGREYALRVKSCES